MNAAARKFLEQDPDSRETREWIEAMVGADADAWSSPRLVELRRDGFASERCKRPHFEVKEQRIPHVERCLAEHDGSVVATADYVSRYASEIRAFMPDDAYHTVLGANSYVHIDSHPSPHHFFEIDRRGIAHAAIAGREWRNDLAGRRARHRGVETRSALAEFVDRVRANMQRFVFAGWACGNSMVHIPTFRSDLSW